MAKDRTPEEDVPYLTRVKRLVGGRGKDVALPMPSGGKRDPRLPRNLGADIREGLRGVQRLTKKSNGRGKRSNGR